MIYNFDTIWRQMSLVKQCLTDKQIDTVIHLYRQTNNEMLEIENKRIETE